MSTIGSLPASWTPPASCSSQNGLYELPESSIDPVHWVNYRLAGPTNTSACMPPSYTGATTDFYYPASICPSGYTTGCQPTVTTAILNAAIVTQIAYTCCPTQRKYSCFNLDDADYSYPWYSTLGCTTSIASTTFTTPITSVNTNGTTSVYTTTVTPGETNGWGAFAILLVAPTATSTSDATIATSDATSTSSSSATSSADVGDASSGSNASPTLSTGAKAGIAVGAVVLAAALGALLLFLRRRKLQQSKPPHTHNETSGIARAEMLDESGQRYAPTAYSHFGPAELPVYDGASKGNANRVYEVDAYQVHEVDATPTENRDT